MADKKNRANVNDTIKMSLLCEVHGKCPLCRKSLLKKKDKKTVRIFDVAHIYPLNPTSHEKELLKDEVRLAKDDDTEDNFIALCKVCHKIYDTNKAVKEYRQLVTIKKDAIKLRELQQTWNEQTLHEDIEQIAEKIATLDLKEIKKTQLSYAALKVKQKKDETFDVVNEIKVENYIINFYNPIKTVFKFLDEQNRYKSDVIYSQVRSYFTFLLEKQFDQNKIFELMCDWFMSTKAIEDRGKSEVLVAFFIQNCEVFKEC